MFDAIRRLLEADSLSPHGICLLWRPELIWTHALSDAVIGTAYFLIPVALASFVSRRRDVAFTWVFWAFAIFILACGATHFFSIWTLWFPDYGIEALIKAATAIASIMTAIALVPLLPKALALPSPTQLRQANGMLEQRVRERDEALVALRRETAERLKAEDMLRQSQKMEALGQLTGGIAHDFNNLLTIVMGNLESIARRIGDDRPLRRSLDNAQAGAERAATLIQQLTLAVNARDAMPAGGVLTIRTRNDGGGEGSDGPAGTSDGGEVAVIEVTDTGTGMSEDVRARVFEPFFTTKPVGCGSGLGLSQVEGFVTQSGGRVAIESTLGQGTSVFLYFPRGPARSAQPPDAAKVA
jgi:signal transduction histidine kinase